MRPFALLALASGLAACAASPAPQSVPTPAAAPLAPPPQAAATTATTARAPDDAPPAPVPLDQLDADVARMPEVARLAQVHYARGPSIAPDGSRVFFVSDRDGTPQVWTAPIGGGDPTRVTHFDDPVTVVTASPDGKHLAIQVAPGGGMNTQIWLSAVDGSDAKRVTPGGKDNNFLSRFSKDGRFLAYQSSARNPASTDTILFDVAKGEARTVSDNGGLATVCDVSRDGKRLLVSRAKRRGDGDLYVVDVATGKDVLLTPHEGPNETLCGGFARDEKSVWLGTNLGRDRVYLARVALGSGGAPGPVEAVAARDDAELESLELTPDATRAIVGWNVGGRSELAVFDLARGKGEALKGTPTEIAFPTSTSRDGGRVALMGASAADTTDVYVLDVAKRAFTRVTHSPHEGIDLASLVRPELATYAAHDGLPLSAWVYRPAPTGGSPAPPGASKGPWPTVLSFHGGPEGQERPALNSFYQALVAKGIAVVAPNVRGSSGFGKRFVNLDNGPLRKGAIEDIAATLDYVAKSGIADPKRVAICGGSYGGYMVMAGLTTYPDRFAAGADLFGIVNFETFFAHSEPWMGAISGSEYGDPVTQRDVLRELSPIHAIDRVRAPTIVLHGANDTNVPVIEAEQVVRALAARGVPVQYVLFPDEGHGFKKPVNRARANVAVVQWFVKHLGASSDR